MKKIFAKPTLIPWMCAGFLTISIHFHSEANVFDDLVNEFEETFGEDSLRNEMFVIVGTYAEEENAVKHVLKIKKSVNTAGYFLNDAKRTYYVYAFKSKSKQVTLDRLFELRTMPQFKDVWFYRHNDNKVRNKPLVAVTSKEPPSAKKETSDLTLTASTSPTLQNEEEDIPVLKASTTISTPNEIIPQEEELEEEKSIDSEVIPTNISLKSPIVEENSESLIDETPKLDAVDQLHTAKSGDFIIFNNLLFHRNAAILHRSSEEDLFALLTYLNDNPASRIKIHGHTNGEFRGEIIKMGKRDKDYFVTSSRNEYVMGDEVLLSMERAKIIKRYLAEKGILEERLEIGGWGGQKTVYPANSEKAALNSRVEIEIL